MMSEKETWENAADFERQVQEMYTAGVPGEEYDELEHLKQQYVDGELTEAEFEQRLEQLDSLEESHTDEPQRDEGKTQIDKIDLVVGVLSAIIGYVFFSSMGNSGSALITLLMGPIVGPWIMFYVRGGWV